VNLVAGVTLLTSGLGWLIWLVGLVVELDTGLPDGTACTGQTGQGYDSCMRQNEIGGLLVWGLTMGLAAFGLALLTRTRHWTRGTFGRRLVTVLAVLGSISLAIANIVVWTRGAEGRYFDGVLGPVWWSTIMTIGLAVGALAGWLLPLDDDRTEPQ
jgi:hypothetical protein